MYHDELDQVMARPREFRRNAPSPGDPAGALAIEVGGGLSLALVASMVAHPFLPILFNLGGLLPLVVQSSSLFLERVFRALDRVAPVAELEPRARLAIPFDLAEVSAIRGPSRKMAASRVMAGSRRFNEY